MKSAKEKGINTGFTIVEIMIVLAVSGAILLSAILLVNGRQAKTEFITAIHDAQAQVQQTIDDTIDGYYPNSNNFVCSSNGASLTVTVGTNGQGTNQGCIFIGKTEQFSISGNPQQVETYTVIGQQLDSSGQQVSDYKAAVAQILVINNNAANPANLVSTAGYSLENGLTVYKMYYCITGGSCTPTSNAGPIGAVAFLNSLASVSNGNLNSGTQNLNLIPIPNSVVKLNDSVATAVTNMNKTGGPRLASEAYNFTITPPSSVNICFASATTNQSGLVSITKGSGQLAVNLSIVSGDTTC